MPRATSLFQQWHLRSPQALTRGKPAGAGPSICSSPPRGIGPRLPLRLVRRERSGRVFWVEAQRPATWTAATPAPEPARPSTPPPSPATRAWRCFAGGDGGVLCHPPFPTHVVGLRLVIPLTDVTGTSLAVARLPGAAKRFRECCSVSAGDFSDDPRGKRLAAGLYANDPQVR